MSSIKDRIKKWPDRKPWPNKPGPKPTPKPGPKPGPKPAPGPDNDGGKPKPLPWPGPKPGPKPTPKPEPKPFPWPDNEGGKPWPGPKPGPTPLPGPKPLPEPKPPWIDENWDQIRPLPHRPHDSVELTPPDKLDGIGDGFKDTVKNISEAWGF